jgi:hypothetical protein
MNRNHIHFAQGLPGTKGVISGMRAAAEVLIYIDLPLALENDVPFSISTNGVVLSPGDPKSPKPGFLPTKYFLRVETAWNHLPLPGWNAPGESTGKQKLDNFDQNVKENQRRAGHVPNSAAFRDDPVAELLAKGRVDQRSA